MILTHNSDLTGIGAITGFDGIMNGNYSIGPTPIATTTLDNDFYNGGDVIIDDDGVGVARSMIFHSPGGAWQL